MVTSSKDKENKEKNKKEKKKKSKDKGYVKAQIALLEANANEPPLKVSIIRVCPISSISSARVS